MPDWASDREKRLAKIQEAMAAWSSAQTGTKAIREECRTDVDGRNARPVEKAFGDPVAARGVAAVCLISFSNDSYNSSASATTGCPATRAIWARTFRYT
jgi:hypothetical protein